MKSSMASIAANCLQVQKTAWFGEGENGFKTEKVPQNGQTH